MHTPNPVTGEIRPNFSFYPTPAIRQLLENSERGLKAVRDAASIPPGSMLWYAVGMGHQMERFALAEYNIQANDANGTAREGGK
ncbi:MAG: hypothetical protein WCI11_12310 [Candidatus Methylumidiphilus sp.]